MMPQIRMVMDSADRPVLRFWCNSFMPHRIRYIGRKYLKGEKTCYGCAFFKYDVLYRANFHCEQEPTEKITKTQVSDLFKWLMGKR